MVDGSSWSPLLDGHVGGIFVLWLKYIGICWSTFGAKTRGLLATKEKCHFNKQSMVIKWQISKYAYKLHGIWGRAVGIAA
jgi:hypothetical protein